METGSVIQTFVGGWSGMQFIRSTSLTTGHIAGSGVVLAVPGSGVTVVPGSGVTVAPGSGIIPKTNIK